MADVSPSGAEVDHAPICWHTPTAGPLRDALFAASVEKIFGRSLRKSSPGLTPEIADGADSCELKYVSPFRSRHGIESARMEGVAFQDSLDGEPQSPNDAVLLDCTHCIV